MQIKEVKYTRLFNLGNYENETIELSAIVEDENIDLVLTELKVICQRNSTLEDRKKNQKQVGTGPNCTPNGVEKHGNI